MVSVYTRIIHAIACLLLIGISVLFFTGCQIRPIHNPSVSQEQFKETEAFKLGGSWTNLTVFCLDKNGMVIEAKTFRPSGDPKLDLLYRDAVSKWRFKPAKLNKQRCLKVRFKVDLGPERNPFDIQDYSKQAITKAVYTPKPSVQLLSRFAKDAGISNWQFMSRISFCVEPDGSVSEVKTWRSTGFAAIDRYLRELVASWKFTPFNVNDHPQYICVIYRFLLNFS